MTVVTDEMSIWVGILDLDGDGPVTGISGPLRNGHSQARVLVRMHGAPLGFVLIPTRPAHTLTARVQSVAGTTLAEALRRHAEWDSSAADADGSAGWVARVACQRHFPAPTGTGITVVICTRDRAELLQKCLRAVRQVSYDPFEILVVDNAPSGDATRELVTALAADDPRLRYTREPRPGLSTARNHGLAQARHEIVAFTDDDTLVDPSWLPAIAAAFATDPEAVCVTGPVVACSLDTAAQRYFEARMAWGEELEPRRYDLATHRQPSRLYPFSAGIFGTGANFAVRASAVSRAGGFDALLGTGGPGRGGEDLDIFLRLILAGGRICYVPTAFVWHEHRAGAQALDEQMYSYGHGLGAYLAKHLPKQELQAALARHGVRRVGALARRMSRASRVSGLPAGNMRLALSEARGVLVGALRYWRAAHQAAEPFRGAQ